MDIVSSNKRSAMMRAVKAKGTKPEMIVRRLVYRLGYRYRLNVKKLPGSPDLVFWGRRRILFVHGCFWHQHPGCRKATIPEGNRDFWFDKLSANVLRDIRVQTALLEAGWQVLVVWECEVADESVLAARLIEFLGSSKRTADSVLKHTPVAL